jgi:hypothetical protein
VRLLRLRAAVPGSLNTMPRNTSGPRPPEGLPPPAPPKLQSDEDEDKEDEPRTRRQRRPVRREVPPPAALRLAMHIVPGLRAALQVAALLCLLLYSAHCTCHASQPICRSSSGVAPTAALCSIPGDELFCEACSLRGRGRLG